MRVTAIPLVNPAAIGLGATAHAGHRTVRGPFLGGEASEPTWLMVAFGGFVAGIVLAMWAGVRPFGAGARL